MSDQTPRQLGGRRSRRDQAGRRARQDERSGARRPAGQDERSGAGRRARRDERGVALMVAVAVTFVIILLSLAAVRQSMNGLTQSGIASKQVSSTDASEAGIQFELDAMDAAVTAGTATFPCAASTNIGPSVPFQASYHLTVALVAGTTAPAASTAACSGSVALTAGDTYLVQSTGTTTSTSLGARTTQADIYVPVGGTVFDQTIFANQSLASEGDVTLTAPDGVYTNGIWTSCYSPMVITGTVTVYGTGRSSLSGCTVKGNLWTDGSLQFYTGASVSGSTETPGTFTGQDPSANGRFSGILYSNSTAPASTTCGVDFTHCDLYTTVTSAMPEAVPPKETFPTVPFTCATPTSATCGTSPWGPTWTVDNEGVAQNGNAACSYANVFADADNGRSTGTIAYWPASCSSLTPATGTPMPVANDFAIVAPSGVDFDNEGTPLTDTSSATHTVYVIVPTTVTSGTTTTTACSGSYGGGIYTNSSATFASKLTIGWFTPCDLTFQNGVTGMTGQLYAGETLDTGTAFTLAGSNAMSLTGAIGGGLGSGSASGTPVLGVEFRASNPAGYT